MRARYAEAELTDPWSTTFELDAPMKAVAHSTLANGLPMRMPAAAVPAAASSRDKSSD